MKHILFCNLDEEDEEEDDDEEHNDPDYRG